MHDNQTQCDRLLAYLEEHPEGITQIEALEELGIMRLASRISNLRQQGVPIAKSSVAIRNRFGETCHVARYRIDDGV